MWGSLCLPRILTGQVVLPSISFPDNDNDDDDVEHDSDCKEKIDEHGVKIPQY